MKVRRFFIIAFKKVKVLGLVSSTFVSRVVLWFNGVSYGKGLKFYGVPLIRSSASSLVSIGARCTFRSSPSSNLIGINRKCVLFIDSNADLRIGSGSGFSGTVIGCFKSIRLGSNVRCGANTLITDSDWHLSDSRVGAPKPVEIGDNVWLGVNVMVLKGVHIGENSVIGAGSVVVGDIPANTIAAGNPCRVIKSLEKTVPS